jgi:GNAT superfamily N-acetyltransferase
MGHDGTNGLNLTICDFPGHRDLSRVKAFLQGRERWQSPPDYWTAGKSTVGTFQTVFDGPASHHRFWHDGSGAYHAYLWLHPEPSETIEGNGNSWRMLIHPEHRSAELAREVMAYAEDMQRRLSDPIGEPELPAGYTIRPLNAKTDVVQRAGVQSDAFAGEPEPGEWALENTERFLRWYQGRDDLDLVAVSNTGEIASFAVFLVDPVTEVGELDPVGTRESHQRKGLSKAVLLSGLQYLRSKNMEVAVVRTGVRNAAAIHTYESVGFSVVDHLYRYTKVP